MLFYQLTEPKVKLRIPAIKLKLLKDGTTIQYKTDSKETQNGSTIENELTNNNMPSLEEES